MKISEVGRLASSRGRDRVYLVTSTSKDPPFFTFLDLDTVEEMEKSVEPISRHSFAWTLGVQACAMFGEGISEAFADDKGVVYAIGDGKEAIEVEDEERPTMPCAPPSGCRG